MQALIQELKRDLSSEKLQILNLLLAQLDIYDAQLKKIRTETNYLAQLQLLEEYMAKDERVPAIPEAA